MHLTLSQWQTDCSDFIQIRSRAGKQGILNVE
jgi:hypothetical protein